MDKRQVRLHPAVPALFANATAGAVFRKGVWGGTNGNLSKRYDTITKAVDARRTTPRSGVRSTS